MRNLNALSLMLAGMSLSDTTRDTSLLSLDERKERRNPSSETKDQKAKRFGLKEWNINGKTVYVATKKKAIKLAQ